jgi:DNA-binding transcriptional LysR family regulator
MVAVRQPRLAGAPRRAARPDALHAQDWLGFSREGTGLRLELQGPAGTARGLVVQPRIASNNQLSIQQMCEAGLGLALMGSMDVQDALQAGRLVAAAAAVVVRHAGHLGRHPQRDAQPAKVRQAIEALQGYLRALPGVSS